MPVLDVERLRRYKVPDARDLYDPRDAILYALGTGAGLSAQVDELDMVFERNLKVLPTMALVLGTAGFWLMDPAVGLDWPRILHGEQSLVLHRPLDPQDELTGSTRIGEIADKGPGKPALFRAYRTLKDLGGNVVAEMTELWVLREAGGFGGARALPGPDPEPLPAAPAPFSLDLPTSRQQALIYRLSGDRNPLHVHPETARLGGFDQPILHGLSTMGLVARALVHLHCGGDPQRPTTGLGLGHRPGRHPSGVWGLAGACLSKRPIAPGPRPSHASRRHARSNPRCCSPPAHRPGIAG